MSSDLMTEEPKQIVRTNSGRVIVFDPVTQDLTTEKKKTFECEKLNTSFVAFRMLIHL